MSNLILRNGKSLEEALAIVSKYSPKSHTLNGKSYFSHAEYVDRMEEAFGKGGYSEEYSDLQVVVLPTVNNTVGQVIASVSCKLAVYNTGGEIILATSGVGTKEITRDTDKKGYISINNVGVFTQQSAFKSACKTWGIFGCLNSSSKEKGETNQNNYTNRNSGSSSGSKGGKTSTQAEKMTFYVKNPLEKVRDDANTGMPVYKLTGHVTVDRRMDSEASTVILYPNCYKKDINKINGMLTAEKEYCISMYVSKGDNAYIFKNF